MLQKHCARVFLAYAHTNYVFRMSFIFPVMFHSSPAALSIIIIIFINFLRHFSMHLRIGKFSCRKYFASHDSRERESSVAMAICWIFYHLISVFISDFRQLNSTQFSISIFFFFFLSFNYNEVATEVVTMCGGTENSYWRIRLKKKMKENKVTQTPITRKIRYTHSL